MSSIFLCSHQSDEPFYIEELNINIYSIEEMAYYLYNNVYFINGDFFDDNLVNHIRNVWKMEQLAQEIEKHIRMRDGYAECMLSILRLSAYYNEEELGEIEFLLSVIGDKSVAERKILRAEKFMECKKYNSASKIYRSILDSVRKNNVSDEDMAKVWYNMGIIDAHRFMYDCAAQNFERSEELYKSEQTEEKFIQSCVLGKLERRIERFSAKYNISDEIVERIRLRIMEKKNDIKNDRATVAINEKLIFDGSINLDEYYNNIDSMLVDWKTEYREEME